MEDVLVGKKEDVEGKRRKRRVCGFYATRGTLTNEFKYLPYSQTKNTDDLIHRVEPAWPHTPCPLAEE